MSSGFFVAFATNQSSMAEAERPVRSKLIQTRPMPVTVGTLPSIVASAATAKVPVKVQADKAAR